MAPGTVAVTLVITSLIVLAGQQNGVSSASTSSEVTTMSVASTTGVEKSTKLSLADQFHVTMIVMIVVLGVIIIFSITCGLCVIFGIDIGCPIPCCGGGGNAKNPGHSASSMKLNPSRPDRISKQRNDVEEIQEGEWKGHPSVYGNDNLVVEF